MAKPADIVQKFMAALGKGLVMAKGGHFGPDFFRFLVDLRDHNDRHWFLAHKDRYETAVRDPFLRFVADLGPLLQKLPSPFTADPSPVGGSMMRIYRDIRFSPDKSPYKTCVAAHFRHVDLKGESAPALYLHLEPGESGLGGGIWRPAPPVAKRIRDAIVRDSSRWRRITQRRRFTSTYTLAGESYTRSPRSTQPVIRSPMISGGKTSSLSRRSRIVKSRRGASSSL